MFLLLGAEYENIVDNKVQDISTCWHFPLWTKGSPLDPAILASGSKILVQFAGQHFPLWTQVSI